MTPLALILARLFGRRLVLQTHGLDIIYRSFLYQQLCVRWLKSCDKVIANSGYTARLGQSKGVPPERIIVIPPGVEPDRFDVPLDGAAGKEPWKVKGRKTILFVGRLAKRKGVKEFIENSFVDIVRAVPRALFLIVGGNPTESLTHRDDVVSEINKVVSKLRLDDHVRLLGSTSDDELIKLYQACDLVVLPALDVKDDVEGFGSKTAAARFVADRIVPKELLTVVPNGVSLEPFLNVPSTGARHNPAVRGGGAGVRVAGDRTLRDREGAVRHIRGRSPRCAAGVRGRPRAGRSRGAAGGD